MDVCWVHCEGIEGANCCMVSFNIALGYLCIVFMGFLVINIEYVLKGNFGHTSWFCY